MLRYVLMPLLILLAGAGPALAQDFVTTKADHAVIVDYETDPVFYAKRADEPMPPASMSKLMTVAVVLDMIETGTIGPDTPFMVSEKAWRTGGSKMFVLVDTEIPVRNLLEGIVTVSGNDACIVVAENISGSEEAFAELMNEKAKEWGLKESRFANPTGLPDENQVMSPRDLARLTKRLWERYPEYRYLFSIPEFTWSDITQKNRNPLLGVMEGALGMKTGHTEESGYGVVGLAEKDGKKRIVVLGGLESYEARTREGVRMMQIAFSEFDTRTLLTSEAPVGAAEVFAGREPDVPLALDSDLTFTLHRRALDGARARIVYTGPLPAPVKAGAQVGVLKLTMPGEEEREYPLYTTKSVKGLTAKAKIGLGLQKLLTPPNQAVLEQ
jgi:D-alanyl-D-alanine carboxypeptidase (penicillin-binding protein 5/6)